MKNSKKDLAWRHYNDIEVCTECGGICHGFIWYGDEPFCDDCFQSMMADLGIREYRFAPAHLIFHSEEDEIHLRELNPHVGIELEIQGSLRNSFCREMKRLYADTHFYMKEDSSLKETKGIEIISAPMTYNFIQKEDKYWEKVFQLLNENEMHDTDGAGLHFHIDRTYCSDRNTVATMEYIVNHFSDYFERIGGRTLDDFYCCKVDKPMELWGTENDDRNCAVNLENENTVELRFCKSTYDYKVFMNRVKMAFGIIYFAEKYALKEIADWNERTFIRHFNGVCRNRFGSVVKTDLTDAA